MYRYEGLLVHESHDDDGIIEIIESKGVRSLHFGTASRQSSICLQHPDRLELDYVRCMMAWRLFRAPPERALIIGLGGGSLTKFLLYQYENIHIRAVEYRSSVVKIARKYFNLPMDPRLKIIIDDGGDYVRKRTDSLENQYDLIFLDAFDHEGMAESLRNEAFFDACKALLSEEGILVINLWGSDKALFEQVTWWVGRAFNWRILFLPVINKGNIIALAFADQVPSIDIKSLRLRAASLETHYNLEFSAFIKEFKRHNLHTLTKIIT